MTTETHLPRCIGIIMDGNRRWAKSHMLPTFEGHRRGYQTLKDVTAWADDVGVRTLIVFAFSEENWNRTPEEVVFMLDLIRYVLTDQVTEAMKKNIRLRFVGNLGKFPADISEGMKKAEKETALNTGITLAIAVSYGGRQEIIRAVQELVAEGKNVTAKDIEAHLYTAGLPDPDVIIRTSGEMRLSGFLPWQSVYSELFFVPTLWPDFSKEEFLEIIRQYSTRERRLGK